VTCKYAKAYTPQMHSMIKTLLTFTFICSSLALAQLELESERFKLIFPSADYEPYAQDIIREAEQALDVLQEYFPVSDAQITINLQDITDDFNAFATPLPRPTIGLRALFPVMNSVGYGAKSDLYLILMHELTHIAIFRTSRGKCCVSTSTLVS